MIKKYIFCLSMFVKFQIWTYTHIQHAGLSIGNVIYNRQIETYQRESHRTFYYSFRRMFTVMGAYNQTHILLQTLIKQDG